MVTGKEAWTELQRMKHAAGQPLGMKLSAVFVLALSLSLSRYRLMLCQSIYLFTYLPTAFTAQRNYFNVI